MKTFRAKTMQQALHLVRQQLGYEATILHTREINGGPLGRWLLGRRVEVVATTSPVAARQESSPPTTSPREAMPAAHEELDYRAIYRAGLGQDLADQLSDLRSMVASLCDKQPSPQGPDLSQAMFEAFTTLIEADVDEATARELLDTLRDEGLDRDSFSASDVRGRLRELVAGLVSTTGPLVTTPGRRRLVALVGPTGVGKTTTIAKLAANLRLREKKRVGLITVDTYRVAAVEQLRTYADIIDLPMEVVATPREMREAVGRMTDLDLVLLDTAGRSPRDEVQIQELKSMLGEAQPDEVHLVLSSTASIGSLIPTAARFGEVGATSLLLTKLDEATSLGHLVKLFRQSGLPASYLTNGQNVPDDILVAQAESLADMLLAGPDEALI
jgi:flagellar biosynthesis protein FlhF